MFDHDHLMKSEQIFDDFLDKDQACVNCDFFNRIKTLEEAGDGHSYKLVQIEDPDNLVSFQLQDEEGTVYGDTIRIPDAQILVDSGFKIVESLPESGPDEEDKNKIFLVPKESEEESDVYDEYIWVNDKWESIGSSKITVDLSDYLTKTEASELYQPKEDSEDPYVKESSLADFAKITEVDSKKVLVLPESVQLMGTIEEAIYALAAIQKYAQEEGADLIQVEVGTTSFHLNLNTADNITYDTPEGKKTLATDEVATSEKKGLLSSEDKAKLDKVDLDTFIIDLSNSDEAKQVHLALVEKYKDITSSQPVQNVYVKNQNRVGLLGKTNLIPITGVAIKSGAPHFFCDLTVQFQFGELPVDSCFGNLEFYFSEDGTASYQVSNTLINSGGNVLNYQDGGLVAKIALKYVSDQRGKVQLTGIGDKVISELDADLYSIPWRVDLPIRTPLNKVFEESEILEWFHVESISELKTVVNTRNLYMKYGILLTGKPMYYNMPIQYAAFESNTQIKLVWVGLNTSNDAATRYTFIVNLDGTVIENECNASLVLEELALKSNLPSFTVIDELTEDYVIPANPTSKEFTYEIHVGETVHNITGAAGIIWQNGEAPNVQANHIYAVSVINNLAVWGEF